ncbi:MAG: radical SAM protein, partial [Clostridium sp.]
MKETSLYIHIPFCKQKCFYCDFPSFAGKEKYREDYIEALCKEILDKCQKYKIKSIFIGGGTPSYLEVHEIKKLLETVNKLQFADNMEFTMECNPGTVNEEKLIAMKDGGINRISFGLQSCNN